MPVCACVIFYIYIIIYINILIYIYNFFIQNLENNWLNL